MVFHSFLLEHTFHALLWAPAWAVQEHSTLHLVVLHSSLSGDIFSAWGSKSDVVTRALFVVTLGRETET